MSSSFRTINPPPIQRGQTRINSILLINSCSAREGEVTPSPLPSVHHQSPLSSSLSRIETAYRGRGKKRDSERHTNNLHRAPLMISNVIYSLPKFVPAPRHSSSAASSPLSRPDSRERKSRRASSLFFSLPLSPFFFRFALTRSKLMIAASLAAIPGRERDFLFSPLFAARCHFSRVPRFTMEDGRTEQSRTIPFPFEYNGVF